MDEEMEKRLFNRLRLMENLHLSIQLRIDTRSEKHVEARARRFNTVVFREFSQQHHFVPEDEPILTAVRRKNSRK